MSDDVKRALEAGARHMAQVQNPEPRDIQHAAAAIAAFLRALPDQYRRGGAAFWDAIPADEETRLWLAAAVERVAQERRR